MTDRTHPDSGRIITSSDVIADLQDRIAELESELEAIGAGGVSGPLMGIASLSANAGEPVAWRLRNTAFRSEVYEYFKTKYLAECRQKQFNASVDDGGLHDLTPLYAAPPTAQAGGWISAAERLPAAYVTVLLTIDGKHITTGEYMHNLSCFSWDQHDDETDDSLVTHWMHLPPPPTSAEGVEHG